MQLCRCLQLAAIGFAAGSGASPLCEPWCRIARCAELNGDVAAECAGCTPGHKCWPGSLDWPRGDAATRCEAHRFLDGDSRNPPGRWGQTTHLYRSSPLAAGSARPARPSCLTDEHALGARRADCTEVESLARLGRRGWVVLRNLAPQSELERLAATAGTIAGREVSSPSSAGPSKPLAYQDLTSTSGDLQPLADG